MSVQVRYRREAASFLASFVGAQGELLVDTTNNRVQVHDGTTPGGSPAAKLSEVVTNTRTALANANYVATVGDRTIAYTSISAARIVTLPPAAAYPTGTALLVVDESGGCSATVTITVRRAGSDLVNGATSTIIALPYGFVALECDGAASWTIIDQATTGLAQQSPGALAITGGTIDGTTIGGTTSAAGTFTTLALSSAAGSAGSINKIALFSTTYGFGISAGSLDYVGANSHSFYRGATLLGQLTSTGLNSCAIGATTAATVKGTVVTATTSLNLPSYTVATLPAAGTLGRAVHCSNARMQTSTAGMLEAAGAGTGGLVTDNGTAWKLAGTNITATA